LNYEVCGVTFLNLYVLKAGGGISIGIILPVSEISQNVADEFLRVVGIGMKNR